MAVEAQELVDEFEQAAKVAIGHAQVALGKVQRAVTEAEYRKGPDGETLATALATFCGVDTSELTEAERKDPRDYRFKLDDREFNMKPLYKDIEKIRDQIAKVKDVHEALENGESSFVTVTQKEGGYTSNETWWNRAFTGESADGLRIRESDLPRYGNAKAYEAYVASAANGLNSAVRQLVTISRNDKDEMEFVVKTHEAGEAITLLTALRTAANAACTILKAEKEERDKWTTSTSISLKDRIRAALALGDRLHTEIKRIQADVPLLALLADLKRIEGSAAYRRLSLQIRNDRVKKAEAEKQRAAMTEGLAKVGEQLVAALAGKPVDIGVLASAFHAFERQELSISNDAGVRDASQLKFEAVDLKVECKEGHRVIGNRWLRDLRFQRLLHTLAAHADLHSSVMAFKKTAEGPFGLHLFVSTASPDDRASALAFAVGLEVAARWLRSRGKNVHDCNEALWTSPRPSFLIGGEAGGVCYGRELLSPQARVFAFGSDFLPTKAESAIATACDWLKGDTPQSATGELHGALAQLGAMLDSRATAIEKFYGGGTAPPQTTKLEVWAARTLEGLFGKDGTLGPSGCTRTLAVVLSGARGARTATGDRASNDLIEFGMGSVYQTAIGFAATKKAVDTLSTTSKLFAKLHICHADKIRSFLHDPAKTVCIVSNGGDPFLIAKRFYYDSSIAEPVYDPDAIHVFRSGIPPKLEGAFANVVVQEITTSVSGYVTETAGEGTAHVACLARALVVCVAQRATFESGGEHYWLGRPEGEVDYCRYCDFASATSSFVSGFGPVCAALAAITTHVAGQEIAADADASAEVPKNQVWRDRKFELWQVALSADAQNARPKPPPKPRPKPQPTPQPVPAAHVHPPPTPPDSETDSESESV